jgi:hypothetical protein
MESAETLQAPCPGSLLAAGALDRTLARRIANLPIAVDSALLAKPNVKN